MAIVELREVRKTYHVGDEDVRALDGVTMTIERGEFMSIMGRSGSGKSTLLNMIGCLDQPTSGRVIIDGVDTGQLHGNKLADLRAHKIGFVFQLHNLVPTLTALENVLLPLGYAGMDHKKERARQAWATAWAIAPRNSPAGSASAWPSPAPSPRSQPSCSRTSRRARWTASSRRRSSR